MAMVGVSMLSTVNTLGRHNETLHDTTFSVGLGLRDLRLDVRQMQVRIGEMARSPTPLVVRRFQREMTVLDRDMRSRGQTIASDFNGDPDLVIALQAEMDQTIPVLEHLTESFSAKDNISTYTLAKTEGANHIAALQRHIDALMVANDVQAKELRDLNRATWERALWVQALIFALGLLVAAGGARFVDRAVVRPTNDISVAINKVARGQLKTPIPHTDRTDEIGAIARATQVFLKRAIAERNASFDLLTELPTRSQLHDQITALRADPLNKDRLACLLSVDVDRFSEINDSHGRDVGDVVLRHVADVLRSWVRVGDFIARDGPDSFVMLLLDRPATEALRGVAMPLVAAIGEPLAISPGSDALRLSCCVGVAPYDSMSPPEVLLDHAEKALIEARRAGPGCSAVYTDEMDARLERRRQTLAGLKFALRHDEIVPFFQPQIETASGKLVGFESLVRWNHPEHGVLSPWQFLGLAEEAGLLNQITETMIEKSLEQFRTWRRMGLNPGRLSLNFTAQDLRHPDFVDRLSLQLERTGLEPEQICVELLESAMIQDIDDPISKTLARLVALGFEIELDDFGTGHAAIATLQMCQFSGVKIDRAFVTGLHARPERRKVVRAMLSMARAMGVRTLAEGVESDADRMVLAQMGCDMIQGFRISVPMDAPAATHWLEAFEVRSCPLDDPLRAASATAS